MDEMALFAEKSAIRQPCLQISLLFYTALCAESQYGTTLFADKSAVTQPFLQISQYGTTLFADQ